MHVVTVRRQNEYGMPAICCACAQPAGSDKLTVSGANFSAPRSRYVELHFPLCDRCATVYRAVKRRKNIGFGVCLGLSMLLCGAAFAIPSTLQASNGNRLAIVSEVLLVLAGLMLIGGLIFRSIAVSVGDESQNASEIYRRVANAAKIRHIEAAYTGRLRRSEFMSLAFGNEEFARLFRRMNVAVVWTNRP